MQRGYPEEGGDCIISRYGVDRVSCLNTIELLNCPNRERLRMSMILHLGQYTKYTDRLPSIMSRQEGKRKGELNHLFRIKTCQMSLGKLLAADLNLSWCCTILKKHRGMLLWHHIRLNRRRHAARVDVVGANTAFPAV
jgi:hypothetical protein